MTLVQSNTIRSDFLAKLIGQFQDKTNIRELLGAFLKQVQDLEVAAFQVLLNTVLTTSVGEQLDVIGRIIGEARQGRNDADYKIALAARILLNIGSGTIEDVLGIVDAMTAGAFTSVLTEGFPASFDVTIDEIITGGAQIGKFVILAKAAGVGASFRWFEGTPEFRFDTVGKGLDEGKLGDAVGA